MKAFLLIASLSFASAIMLVPHDGNETRPSVHDAVVPEKSTGTSVSKHFVTHLNFTNDVNTKHRPHLAIVETRKLFENEDNDDNYSNDDDGDDDSDDNNDVDDSNDFQDDSGSRRLLRHSKAAPKVAAPPKVAAVAAAPKVAAPPKVAAVAAPP